MSFLTSQDPYMCIHSEFMAQTDVLAQTVPALCLQSALNLINCWENTRLVLLQQGAKSGEENQERGAKTNNTHK